MTLRTFLCGSAMGLVIALGFTAPGWAQNSRGQAFEERTLTRDLNRDSARGRAARPARRQSPDYDNARSQYETARERYLEELDEYNARLRDYYQQLDNYAQGRGFSDGPPNGDEDRYDDQDGPAYGAPGAEPDADYGEGDNSYDAPQEPADNQDEFVTLDRFADPNKELYNTPVVDIDGYSVGRFRRIEFRDNGDVMAVVTLNAMRTVSVPVEYVAFDSIDQIIVARLTVNDFDVIPSGQ